MSGFSCYGSAENAHAFDDEERQEPKAIPDQSRSRNAGWIAGLVIMFIFAAAFASGRVKGINSSSVLKMAKMIKDNYHYTFYFGNGAEITILQPTGAPISQSVPVASPVSFPSPYYGAPPSAGIISTSEPSPVATPSPGSGAISTPEPSATATVPPGPSVLISLPFSYPFDGKTSFLNLGATPSRKTIPSSFSIVMWVTANAVSGRQYLVTYGRSPSNVEGEFAFFLQDNCLAFWDYGAGHYGFDGRLVSTSTVSAGTRTQVAFVRDGLKGYYYINGAKAGVTKSSHSVTYTNENLCLGFDYKDQSNYFGGVMEKVQIYSGALPATNIQALYNDVMTTSEPSAAVTSPPGSDFQHSPSRV